VNPQSRMRYAKSLNGYCYPLDANAIAGANALEYDKALIDGL